MMNLEFRRVRLLAPALIISAFFMSDYAAAQASPPGAPTAGAQGNGPGQGGAQTVRTVQEIKFTGNKKVSTAQLASQIGLKVGDVNTKEAVGAAMTKIGDIYKQAGKDLSYMVDISLPDDTHTIVNFIIDENGTGGNKGAAPRAGGGGMGGPGGPPPGGAPPATPAK